MNLIAVAGAPAAGALVTRPGRFTSIMIAVIALLAGMIFTLLAAHRRRRSGA